MDPTPTIAAMRDAARALQGADVVDQLRAVQRAQDALDGAKSLLLSELAASKGFEAEGDATLNAWVRNKLHFTAKGATTLVRNAEALRDLPLAAEAAMAGRLSAEHLKVFVYGIRQLGLGLMRQHEEVLVDVAVNKEPGEFFGVIRHLKELTHPEELDEAWKDGMDKEDFQVLAVPDGWHLTGFLNTATGAKLKKVIDALSAPHDADDTRTGSQRRVQAVDDLASAVLANGLPNDKGVRPQLQVIVDADTVAAAAEHAQQAAEQTAEHPDAEPPPAPPVEPATLVGHGVIGLNLLSYMLCVSDFTAFLMKQHGGARQAELLNVGRTRYAPNKKQRDGVLVRQKGVCATPGCNHTHLEIHHVIWWSRGGTTDINLLIGLCVRCHHLLHRGLLNITGNAVDGFHFTNKTGRPLTQRRRASYRRAA